MARLAKNADRGFVVRPFTYPSGRVVWEVRGYLDGKRTREYFDTQGQAETRRVELELLRIGRKAVEIPRSTWLSHEQLKVAEWVFTRTTEPAEVRTAMEYWSKIGKNAVAATEHAAGVTLDEAVAKFEEYLRTAVDLRDATKRNLKYRAAMFASEVGNLELSKITPGTVEGWLATRKASPVTRDNDRRALARFFSWCIARPQRFLVSNPCREVRVAKPEKGEPEIYSLTEVHRLLAAARRFRGGRFLKFVVLQLFGGMRPTEALRYRDAQHVGESIRIEGRQTKTGRGRTIEADPVLVAWLNVAGKGPVSDPQRSKLLWGGLKAKARIGRWIPDGLRHTAVSHHFRRSGSYGLTAEWAGNSEAVIRAHYQARTTPEETARFWTLFPDRSERQRARKVGTKGERVVEFPKAA